MSYTGNHRIDAVLLVAINDGDGSQCGQSYRERIEHARKENPAHEYEGREFWNALFRYCARRELRAGYPDMPDEECRQGAKFLRQYYADLIAEGA